MGVKETISNLDRISRITSSTSAIIFHDNNYVVPFYVEDPINMKLLTLLFTLQQIENTKNDGIVLITNSIFRCANELQFEQCDCKQSTGKFDAE